MTALLAAPILVTLTLLVSGLAKLGARQGTEDAMTSLRLPLRGTHRLVANVLPALEILLALALWIPLVPLQVVVATLIALLLISYLVIIARALTFEETVECSCFGTLASPTVSFSTLGRNIVLSGLGLATVVAAASGLLSAALVQAPLALVGFGAALLLAIILTALTLGGTASTGDEAAGSGSGRAHGAAPAAAANSVDGADGGAAAAEDEEVLDYERTPIPGAVLQLPSGRLTTLRQVTAHRAALLVFVSEGCGPCERVLDHGASWIEELSPYLQVLFVFAVPLEHRRERTVQRIGDSALHDMQSVARNALGAKSSPSAVLLGADGQLAGGPVNGGTEVIEFVQDIQEQLLEAQAGEEPAAPAAGPPTS